MLARLHRCRPFGRCRLRFCPPCARRIAIGDRLRLQERIAAAAGPLVLVTVTVGVDTLAQGWRVLSEGLRAIRRQRWWSQAVVGGSQHAQLVPSGGRRRWCVHAHILAELAGGAPLDAERLAFEWTSLVAAEDLRGSTDVRPVTMLWVPCRTPRHGRRFAPVAEYVTRQVRREWLGYSDAALSALLLFLPNRRLSAPFGTWYGRPRANEFVPRVVDGDEPIRLPGESVITLSKSSGSKRNGRYDTITIHLDGTVSRRPPTPEERAICVVVARMRRLRAAKARRPARPAPVLRIVPRRHVRAARGEGKRVAQAAGAGDDGDPDAMSPELGRFLNWLVDEAMKDTGER